MREAPADSDLQEIAKELPRSLRMGTSSWAFPGWAGIVYDRPAATGALSRRGLEPYGRHPLLRCVGVDRSFYAPLPASQFEEYAALVPDDFRFVVKADRGLTFPQFARPADTSTGRSYHENRDFLDPHRATATVIEPVVKGLGAKLGALLFQFPPVPARAVGGAQRFARELGRFLRELPTGIPYAVEVRTRELLVPEVRSAITDAGATLACSVHPSLPAISEQLADDVPSEGPLIIRWMLGHGQRYEDAKDRYTPFDRLVDPDPTSRGAIAAACLDAAFAGRNVFVVVNNKAEGSSPLSVIELAREVADRQRSAA